MKIPDCISPDYKVPRMYIDPLMNHLESTYNELVDVFWRPIGNKDHSGDAIAWWQEVSPPDQIILAQVLASDAAPVLVWECSGYLFSSGIAPVYRIIPDCEDLIAPLFMWEDDGGTSFCTLRIDNRSVLLEYITLTLVPSQNTGGTTISCSLLAEDFFVFCVIIASLRNATYNSYLNHDSVPDSISHEQILSLVKDPDYLLDTRWTLPTALEVTHHWLGDWAGTAISKHIDALKRMNLVTVGDDESNYGLTDVGRMIQQAFLHSITSLCSRTSSMADTGIRMDPYFRTIRSGFCDLFIDLGISDPSICQILLNTQNGEHPMINEKVNGTYD